VELTRVAVILVAGVGSRLRPLTDDRPKALVDLGGETILGRTVRLLREHGVTRLVLATGYREDAVRAALENVPITAVFCQNSRFDSTQNSVSLALCAQAVAGEACFKLDGDVVFRSEVLERLDRVENGLAVAVDRTRSCDDEAMKFRVDAAGRIVEFGKGISLAAAGGESIGIERISAGAVPVVFDALRQTIESGRVDAYYEDIYSEQIARGALEARAVDVGDLEWTEVDDLRDLERARSLATRI
jgi:choline kinase